MRARNIAIFSAAALAGLIAGSAIGPKPASAVARELIELQRDVTSILQGQKDLSTQMTQDHTVMKTLVEQSGDTVGKLNATMSGLQKSVQDVQANSGARLDTMSTQVQGLSDNLPTPKKILNKADGDSNKVPPNTPKPSRPPPAHKKKGMPLMKKGQKPAGVRELRDVIRRFPGTEEDRRARAKLKELNIPVT